MDDQELNQLLREWKAPNAPPDMRPRRARGSRLRWLVSGTLLVPVPVALAALLLIALWTAATRLGPMPTREESAPRRSGEIARYPLTGALAGYDAVLVELNFQPGVSVPEHRHPGPIIGYVVNGRMRTAINHQPDQIVPAGGTFFEPHGALHTSFSSAEPDTPVHAVAVLVVPNGSPLTERAAATREPQTPQAPPMPYTAIHHPEFVAASEAAFLQDDDLVAGLLDVAQQVRGDHDVDAAVTDLADQSEHPLAMRRIEPVRRLVEEDELRVAKERAGDPQPLLHAERVRRELAVGTLAEVNQGQEPIENLAPLEDLRIGNPGRNGPRPGDGQ